jgi:HD-GYP domain-containing protein (c-di-GMP phosphodiesterase class II)
MERLREAVTKGFWGMTESRALENALGAKRKKTADPDEELAAPLPRFSRSQIRYAPESESRQAAGKPRSHLVAWEARKSRLRRQASADDESIRDRLATFEEIIASLRPDVAGFFNGLVPQVGKRAVAKAIKWKMPRLRPRTFNREQSDELGIPRFIDLVVYRDRVGIEGEVAKAREAMTLAEDTLSRLKIDAAREAMLRVDGLPDVVEALTASVARNADAMIWVSRVRLNNSTAYSHSIKVASYLLAFGRHLGFPTTELTQLAHIGLLMDIGKLELDPQLVNKTGPLLPEEFVELQRHVDLGLARLESTMQLPRAVIEGIAQHHEWIDGSGYPAGLSGEQIGIYGRMAAIADMYAALTTHRPYAPTMSSYDALQLMYARAHAQLHGPLVEQFVRAIGLYPVGSLVLLNTEEVAVVTALDKVQRLEPRVLVLTGPDKNTLERPFELDLMRGPKDARGNQIKILRSLPAGVHNIDFRNFYIA